MYVIFGIVWCNLFSWWLIDCCSGFPIPDRGRGQASREWQDETDIRFDWRRYDCSFFSAPPGFELLPHRLLGFFKSQTGFLINRKFVTTWYFAYIISWDIEEKDSSHSASSQNDRKGTGMTEKSEFISEYCMKDRDLRVASLLVMTTACHCEEHRETKSNDVTKQSLKKF